MYCGEVLEEVKSLRTLSDKRMVEAIPTELSSNSQKETAKQRRAQAIIVIVRDELVSVVDIGRCYQFIGICRTDVFGEEIIITLEANNCLPLSRCPSPRDCSLLQSLNADGSFPWKIPFVLALMFAEEIAPGGVMLKLKLLLLISLVTNPMKRLFHLMVIGSETKTVRDLMDFSRKFALREFSTSQNTPLIGKITPDVLDGSPYFIRAGSLSLSSGGVNLLHDISLWKKAQKEQLQSILSGGKYQLEVSSKYTGGLPHHLVFQLLCHVWGYYSAAETKPLKKSELPLQGCDIGDYSKQFLDSFGYICFLESGDSVLQESVTDLMALHVLSNCCDPQNDQNATSLSFEQLDKYISDCRSIEPSMTVEAESLVLNYYTASRRARSSSFNGSNVPQSALESLMTLSYGIAKLRQCKVVLETDALLAIFLYEESLTSRNGLSVLNVRPQPHLASNSLDEFIGEKSGTFIQQFYKSVASFCSRASFSHCVIKEE